MGPKHWTIRDKYKSFTKAVLCFITLLDDLKKNFSTFSVGKVVLPAATRQDRQIKTNLSTYCTSVCSDISVHIMQCNVEINMNQHLTLMHFPIRLAIHKTHMMLGYAGYMVYFNVQNYILTSPVCNIIIIMLSFIQYFPLYDLEIDGFTCHVGSKFNWKTDVWAQLRLRSCFKHLGSISLIYFLLRQDIAVGQNSVSIVNGNQGGRSSFIWLEGLIVLYFIGLSSYLLKW